MEPHLSQLSMLLFRLFHQELLYAEVVLLSGCTSLLCIIIGLRWVWLFVLWTHSVSMPLWVNLLNGISLGLFPLTSTTTTREALDLSCPTLSESCQRVV